MEKVNIITSKNLLPLPAVFSACAIACSINITIITDVLAIESSTGTTILSREDRFVKAKRLREEGLALLDTKHFDEAKKKFEEALALQPDSDILISNLHQHLAEIYLESKNYSEGVTHAKMALQYDPNAWTTMQELVICYGKQGQLEEAISWAQKAIKASQDENHAQRIRSSIQGDIATKCNALITEGEFKTARKFLDVGLSFDPSNNSAWVHAVLARLFLQLGEPHKALPENQLALNYEPMNQMAIMNQAEYYADLGRCNEAMTWAKKALQQDLTNEEKSDMERLIHDIEPILAAPALNDPNLPDYLQSTATLLPNQKTCPWPESKMPLKVYIEPGIEVDGYRESFRQIFLESLDAWSKASGNRVTYTVVVDPKQADISCHWISSPNQFPKECRGLNAQGFTACPWGVDDNGRQIVTGPTSIHLLTKPWQPRPALTDSQMKFVAMHEVGHALGIAGHSSISIDIMGYPSPLDMENPHLTQRDVNTIQRLYSGGYSPKDAKSVND